MTNPKEVFDQLEKVQLIRDFIHAPYELIHFPRQMFHNITHAWVDLVTPISKVVGNPEQVAKALEWFGH